VPICTAEAPNALNWIVTRRSANHPTEPVMLLARILGENCRSMADAVPTAAEHLTSISGSIRGTPTNYWSLCSIHRLWVTAGEQVGGRAAYVR
jgi:hypothetical protein